MNLLQNGSLTSSSKFLFLRKKKKMTARLTKETVNQRLEGRGIRLVGGYTRNSNKTLFKCLKDHEWMATPDSIMRASGCPHCAGNSPLSEKIVNQRLNGRGIRLVGDYINNITKTLFQCPEGHEWKATPSSVMSGAGCPSCAKHGFDPSKPAILYYIKFDIDSGPLWKIGITNRTVEDRFMLEKIRFRILKQWQYDDGSEALDREREILSMFEHHRYNGPQVLRDGNSELFNIDVLCLEELSNEHPR